MFSLSLDLEDRLPFANVHKKIDRDDSTHLLAFANICLESQLCGLGGIKWVFFKKYRPGLTKFKKST